MNTYPNLNITRFVSYQKSTAIVCIMHIDLLTIHYYLQYVVFLIIDELQFFWILLIVVHNQTTWFLPSSHWYDLSTRFIIANTMYF